MCKEANLLNDWELIAAYSRQQALDDGVLVDVSSVADEAGFVYPTALTREVYDRFVRVPDSVSWQDEKGRLWDILWMLRMAVFTRKNPGPELLFELLVQNEPGNAKTVTLKSVCGLGDTGEPVITVMLPEED